MANAALKVLLPATLSTGGRYGSSRDDASCMLAHSATNNAIVVVPLVLASGAAVLAHAVFILMLYVAANCAGTVFHCVVFISAMLAAWDGAVVAKIVCQPLMLGVTWPVAADGALAIRHGMLRQ